MHAHLKEERVRVFAIVLPWEQVLYVKRPWGNNSERGRTVVKLVDILSGSIVL